MKNNFILSMMLLAHCASFAQMTSYDYKRRVKKIEKNNYYSVKISPAIMAKSKSHLSDIRIYDAGEKDTVEVPYIQEWLGLYTEEFEVPSAMINESYSDKCCSYVTFKFEGKESINRIQLKVEEDNFDKSVKLEGSDDNKKWFTIREHLRIVGFTNSDMKVKYTALDFSLSEHTYFRVTLDDLNSDKIKILGASTMDVNTRKPGSYSELPIVSRKDSLNKQNKTTEIILDLKQNFFISHVILLPKKRKDFFRNVNLYYSSGTISSPKGNFENWTLDGTGVLRSDDENKISFFNPQSSKIKIKIFNRDDQPIEIPEIKVFSKDVRLVSILPVSDNLFLLYGKQNDAGGTYDMVHFTDKIPAQMNDAGYGDEMTKEIIAEEKNPLFKEKMFLWIIMGAIILIIAMFSLRMLKSNNQN